MCVVILSTLGTVSIHLSVESSLLQVLSQLRVFALPCKFAFIRDVRMRLTV